MQTLTLRALSSLSAPLADTPVLPLFDPSKLFSYNLSSARFNNGSLTSWKNAQGTKGVAADLTSVTASAPTATTQGVKFTKANSQSISTAQFAEPIPVPVLTVLVAIKFSSLSVDGDAGIFTGLNTDAYAYARRLGSGKISIGVQAVAQIESNIAAPMNEWVFIAVTFNGAASKLQVNNDVVSGNTGSVNLQGFKLGVNSAGSGGFLDGEIAGIQVFNRMLDAGELAKLRTEMIPA